MVRNLSQHAEATTFDLIFNNENQPDKLVIWFIKVISEPAQISGFKETRKSFGKTDSACLIKAAELKSEAFI